MQPQLGWVWLSQAERRAAEQALGEIGPDGTRDELGFGVIHFAYADRFFPGTSVQHTSLRYVWFTCWTYQELAARHAGEAFPLKARKAIEDRTGYKLIGKYGPGDGNGIIGGRVLRRRLSPVTKPSAVYWSAMRAWGLIARVAGEDMAPTQGELEWRWDTLISRAKRPEVDRGDPYSIFLDPPPIPKRWGSSDPISFELDPNGDEAGRIRRAWSSMRVEPGRQTLLSRLAERGGVPPTRLASRALLALCEPDERASIVRAEQAGALAGIARSIHVLLVQRLKDRNADACRDARAWVDASVGAYGERAVALNLSALRDDVGDIGSLSTLMDATQAWLRDGAGDVSSLEPLYRAREMEARPGRALLALDAVERRDGWRARPRLPLTYRWDKVRNFLDELAAA